MPAILATFTYEDITSWDPCYDPLRYIPESWEGNALDILKLTQVPAKDRLWVVLRHEAIASDRILRLFAVWCCRQVQSLMADPRSVTILDIAERYANGEATAQELRTAKLAGNTYDSYAAAYVAAAYVAARDRQVEQLIKMLEAV
jgi:hypothetical protein